MGAALTNLANATVADREIMSDLTAITASHTQQLTETNSKLSQALTLTTALQKEVQELKRGKTKRPTLAKVVCDKYCWTHEVNCGHTSANFDHRARGHKEEATEEVPDIVQENAPSTKKRKGSKVNATVKSSAKPQSGEQDQLNGALNQREDTKSEPGLKGKKKKKKKKKSQEEKKLTEQEKEKKEEHQYLE